MGYNMTNTMQNTCVTCPNFNPVVEDQGVSQIHRGECRASVMAMQQQPAAVGQSVFPAVQSDSWCVLHPVRWKEKMENS